MLKALAPSDFKLIEHEARAEAITLDLGTVAY